MGIRKKWKLLHFQGRMSKNLPILNSTFLLSYLVCDQILCSMVCQTSCLLQFWTTFTTAHLGFLSHFEPDSVLKLLLAFGIVTIKSLVLLADHRCC